MIVEHMTDEPKIHLPSYSVEDRPPVVSTSGGKDGRVLSPRSTEGADSHVNDVRNHAAEKRPATLQEGHQTSEQREAAEHLGGNEDGIAFTGETGESDLDNGQTDPVGETTVLASENKQLGVSSEKEALSAPIFQDKTSNVAAENGPRTENLHHDCAKDEELQDTFLEDVKACWSKNLRQEDAAKELGYSLSTLKRRLRDFGISGWPRGKIRKQLYVGMQREQSSESESKFSKLGSLNDWNLVHEPASECLFDQYTIASPIRCCANNEAISVTVRESRIATGNQIFSDEGLVECKTTSAAMHYDVPSTFVVKATCEEDTVRISFSSTSSLDDLKERLGKKLNLELGRFKIKYQDEDAEWILLTDNSDLQDALHVTRSLGSYVVRLMVIKL